MRLYAPFLLLLPILVCTAAEIYSNRMVLETHITNLVVSETNTRTDTEDAVGGGTAPQSVEEYIAVSPTTMASLSSNGDNREKLRDRQYLPEQFRSNGMQEVETSTVQITTPSLRMTSFRAQLPRVEKRALAQLTDAPKDANTTSAELELELRFLTLPTESTPTKLSGMNPTDMLPYQIPSSWPYFRFAPARRAGQTSTTSLTQFYNSEEVVATVLVPLVWYPRPLHNQATLFNYTYSSILVSETGDNKRQPVLRPGLDAKDQTGLLLPGSLSTHDEFLVV